MRNQSDTYYLFKLLYLLGIKDVVQHDWSVSDFEMRAYKYEHELEVYKRATTHES